MNKQSWKPGNMLYPVPAVLVSCRDKKGNDNLLTVAWTGTVNSDPPMAYISVRQERHSYPMIRETGEFVINLTTKALASATDYCGVKSGSDTDKWAETGLTKLEAKKVNAPMVGESPVNIECRVTDVIPLGSHHMFLAEVVNVNISGDYMRDDGTFDLAKAEPIVYSHGWYYELGGALGKFGCSVAGKRRTRHTAAENRKNNRRKEKNV